MTAETSAPPIERTCLYCGQRLMPHETVAMCTVCFAGHHESCWLRNGRCSTFRCTGQPRMLPGHAYAVALVQSLEEANASPQKCPLCGNPVYAGRVCPRIGPPNEQRPSGIVFAAVEMRAGKANRGVRGLWGRLVGSHRWLLPGAQLRGRSCGNCRTLFLWGVPVDDAYIAQAWEYARDSYCAYCGTGMAAGELQLGASRFWCDAVPTFHSDWLRHQILDRFIYNRWPLRIRSLPAASCPRCHYTEVHGRPVYRVS